MTAAIDELKQFLRPETPAIVKGPAVCYLLGLTATEDGLAVFRRNEDLVKALCDLVEHDSNSTVVGKSMETVLNLSSHADFASLISAEADFVRRVLIAESLDATRPHVARACATIANITQTPESAAKLWPLLEPSADDLLDAFCRRNETTSSSGDVDTSQDHIAFIFANVTALNEARAWFTDSTQQRLEKLLPFVSLPSTSLTRKHGVVGTIRNCAFDTATHRWLLERVAILPRLLVPLIGGEVDENLDEDEMEKLPVDCQYLGVEKKVEPNPDIRKMLIETLTQLCATRFGRNHMKSNGVYYVLRELHKVVDYYYYYFEYTFYVETQMYMYRNSSPRSRRTGPLWWRARI